MNLPVEVIEAIREGRCALFLGSRASKEAAEVHGLDYPSAKDLARQLGWRPPKPRIGSRRKTVTPSVLAGASTYQQQSDREGLLRTLNETIGLTEAEPTPAHTTALGRFPLIFTTCLDDLLERAGAAQSQALQVVQRGEPIPDVDPTTPIVVRLRGSLNEPEHAQLTVEDRAAGFFEPDYRKQIRNLVRKWVILFVGYRPDEEEFEHLWEDLTVCYGGELPRCHLAVAQGRISDYQWQKWVWRGLLLFTADPTECMDEIVSRLDG